MSRLQLRIYRTYTWECLLPASEIRYGGMNPLSLVPHDELQYLAYDDKNDPTYNVWKAIPIVEEKAPEHPSKKEERERLEEFAKQLDAELPRILEEIKAAQQQEKQTHGTE